MKTIVAASSGEEYSDSFRVSEQEHSGDAYIEATLPCKITATGLSGSELVELEQLVAVGSPETWQSCYDINNNQMALTADDAALACTVLTILEPGIYRVKKSASSTSPVTAGTVNLHTSDSP